MEKQIASLYQPLFLFVRKRIHNREDAEDLTQEVFYKLSRSRNDEVENIKSWLYTIAKNTITDYYRKNKVETEEIRDVACFETDVYEDCAAELSKCITPFVNKLPEEYRNIITLSELENIPQKEIAEKLNMNYVTVRSKVQRGRKKLKNVFSECCTIVQGGKGSIIGYKKNNSCGRSKNC